LFWEKIRNSFLLYKLQKEASKEEKFAKVLKPQKLKKTSKQKKPLVLTLPIKHIFSFLSLDNETVENQCQLMMVGFKVFSYFRLMILCRIFYLCSSKRLPGDCFLLNTKAGHSFSF